jgi:hypothetical protein
MQQFMHLIQPGVWVDVHGRLAQRDASCVVVAEEIEEVIDDAG